MSRFIVMFSRAGKWMRYLASTLLIAAGLMYLTHPPRTTARYFEGEWPALVWGVLMLVGGGIILWGLQSRILQIEQYGMLMVGTGAGLLSIGQTMVMLDGPTWTRGGGTAVLWALVAFSAARYFELSAEIRSARLARQRGEG